MNPFNDDDQSSRNIIKLRGLPWNTTANEIMDFLKDVNVADGEKGIHMAVSNRDGRPNGEAFVELETMDDVDRAFTYNKNLLGHRYIEIFNAKPEEFDQCMRRQNVMQQDTFIKLRGLPFSCKLDDIEQFFSGLEIRNGKTGIYIVYDSHGRMTGECFVQFRTSDDAENALKRNREKIGHRYIELFRSSASECRRSTMLQSRGNQGFGGNDRMMNRGGGPGPRNNRNFRDRPYPDNNWLDNPFRGNNNRGGNNFGNDNFGGSGGNNMFNDNFGDLSKCADKLLKLTQDSFSLDRKWNSNNSNNSNDRGGFGGNNGNNNFGGNNSFGGGGFGGGNNFGNNRDNGPGNFGNDRGGFNGNMNGNNMGNNGGRFLVHLRGMPYDCSELEVQQFFAPLKVVDCEIIYDDRGRPSGEADAYFSTVEDAQEAMKRHKEKMGSRYIELFASRNSGRGRF